MGGQREGDASPNVTSQPLPDSSATQPQNDLAYPEGGLQGWLVVLGSFCASFSVFGVINTAAVFESYLSENQLAHESKSNIGWIFSTYLFTVYSVGIFVGPCFDRYGSRILIAVGSVLMVAGPMTLSWCTEYYQFFLSFSICMGLGGAFLNSPSLGAIGHYFFEKRGIATGLAMSAGAIGGLVFPAPATRNFTINRIPMEHAHVGVHTPLLGCTHERFIRTRLPPKKGAGLALPDVRMFHNIKFSLCCIGIFFMEFGVLMPLTYIVSFANDHGQSMENSYILPSLLNAGSVLGRPIPGLIADKIGRFNTLIGTIGLCAVSVLALWLPSGNSRPLLIAFTVILGFASGGNVSLVPVCVGQLCDSQDYGRFLSAAMIGASLGTFTGIPIGGALVGIGEQQTGWTALVLFSGLSYVVSFMCYVAVRVMAVGWDLRAVF